jgi:hypothetical protein
MRQICHGRFLLIGILIHLFQPLQFVWGVEQNQNEIFETKFTTRTSEGITKETFREFAFISAVIELINKAMKKIEVGSDIYWKEYEEKFLDYWNPQEKIFRQNYPLSQANQYPGAARIKKIEEKIFFVKNSEIFKCVKEILKNEFNQDTLPINTKFTFSGVSSLKLALNLDCLKENVTSLIGKRKIRNIKKVDLEIEIKNSNAVWSEWGIYTQDDFKDSLKEYWIDKINTQIFKKDSLLKNENLLQTEIQTEIQAETKIIGKDEVLPLVAEIQLNLVEQNPKLKKIKFSVYLDLYIKDPISERYIYLNENITRNREFFYKDKLDLSNQLVTFISKIPINRFSEISQKIKELPHNIIKYPFIIENIQKWDQWLNIKEHFALQGKKFKFQIEMDSWKNGVVSAKGLGEGDQQDFEQAFEKLFIKNDSSMSHNLNYKDKALKNILVFGEGVVSETY